MLVLVNLDLSQNQLLNAVVQVLASAPVSPVAGQAYYNSVSGTLQVYTGAAWRVLGTLDQISAPAADVSLNSHKITSLSDPASAQDAATKNYVDNAIQGLSWKDTARAASTANVTVSSPGTAIDGITLANGDRVLLKSQTTGSENGIYTFNGSAAAMTRTADASTGAELVGAAVWIDQGTANASTAWVCTTPAPITVGSTSLAFTQFGGGTTYSAGTGLSLAGSVFSLSTPVSIADGGTNATTAAAALANLGGTAKYATSIGDGTSTSYTVTHSLGTLDAVVQVYRNSDGVQVIANITRATTNTVTVAFAVAPTSNQYRVVVHA